MSDIPADEITIGETGLEKGDTFLYIYNYGAEWRVDCCRGDDGTVRFLKQSTGKNGQFL
ncbi:plasmid pRiA4b ORF-3 family protein [Halobacillus sp. A1]|uniref:plasmid pRiA4b ORF-3 family protein n=1 Tax=Halobacillus sp. A1 TaxID=2880262 RepID=UPI0020A6C611|nr:plasmid pRiA4b ORF-3 family protein [Halobacillus sp. A1]MCP3032882.1 plasmid pRiA4b ORF-3 family protein [Halobacillus sp. A1]